MASFSITIDDTKSLAGLKAAREAYNNSLPEIKDDKGKVIKHPDFCATDQDYIQFVMSKACESYAKQYNV